MSVPADITCTCWPSEYQWAFWLAVIVIYVVFKRYVSKWIEARIERRWRDGPDEPDQPAPVQGEDR